MATQALDLKPIEAKLVTLKQMAEAIQVTDAESYAAACQIAVQGRAEVKAIGFVLDPGIQSAKNHLDELKNQKAAFVNQVTPIVDIATGKAETWKRAEREAAQREQDRLNAIARENARIKAEQERKEAEAKAEADRKQREKEIKEAQKAGEVGKREGERLKKEAAAQEEADKKAAAEQAQVTAANVAEVKVQAAVPKVAGIRALVLWKYKIVNESLIPRVFLQPNDVAIGAMVRNTKNKAEAEAKCAGIEVFTEDSV
jgi:hypothetical protein